MAFTKVVAAGIETSITLTVSNLNVGIVTATQFSTGGINIGSSSITGPSVLVIDPATVDDNTGAVRIKGDLYVDGTQTVISSSIVDIGDFRVGLATTATSDVILDGAGIGIGSASNQKTFTWNNSSSSLKSSEHLDLASGKSYKIDGVTLLSATSLGSSITSSSLTSVGTLGQLQVAGVSTFASNIGIGITPSAWNSTWKTVTVNTAYFGGFTPSNGLAIGNNNYVQPAGGYLYVNTGSATQYQQTGAGDHFWRIAPSGTAGSAVTFTQAMTLDASGNFYVGTTSQTGGSNITFNQPANADMKVAASVSTGTRATYQVFVNNTITTVGTENSTGGSLASGTASYATVLANSGAYPISFATNNSEKMRLDSSGNLGLGVSPSAWSGIWKSLDFYSSSLSSRNDVLITRLNNNAYNNGTSWTYKNTGVSQSYIQGTSGEHAWYIAPSGTAGAAVTFTQAMTLDSSGNLQLGTTTNPDSRRFRVYGISEFDGNGVSLTVYKSSGTKVGSSGQGDYIVSGGPSSGFGIQSESALVFGTGGTTERARIDTSGNVGIATANPTRKLQVIGDAEFSDVYYTTSYPSIRPSIDLNFAQTKVLDPRINFYRNSFGTYTDDMGIIRTVPDNVPRFDHNPATGESLGLLLEESRTNYVRYSTNFTLAEWASSMSSTVADQTTAPDGTNTADLITGTGLLRYFTSTVSYNSTGVHTISLYAKAGTSTTIRLNRYDGTNDEGATFNLTGSGSVTNEYGPPDRTYIQQLANGWYRCELTCTNLASADFQIHLDNAGTVFIWGAQFEAGSFATSYIPTSGSTVTRAVDSVSIANPAFSFPCSIYGEYDTQVLQYARRLYEIIPTGATGNQSIRPLIQNSGDFDFFTSYTSNHGVTGPAIVNTGFKFCQVIRTSGYNTISLNGGAVTNSSTTTTLTSTSASSLVLGNSSFGDSPRTWCGHIKRFMIYSNTLTNTQIQNLTL